jgi:ATP-binding cassette, subfamily B, bacterial
MQLLYKYLKGEWRSIVVLLTFTALGSLFSLAEPIPFQWIADQYLTLKNGNISFNQQYTDTQFISGVGMILLLTIGLALMARLANSFAGYYQSMTIAKITLKMYTDGIKKSLSLPFQDLEDQRSGKTLSVIEKVKEDTTKLLTQFITTVFGSLVSIVFVIIYSAVIHWSIGVIFIASIIVLAFLSAIITKRIKIIQQKIVKEQTDLAGATTESLRNIEIVKGMGLVEQEKNRLDKAALKILDLTLEKFIKTRGIQFVQGTVVQLSRTIITGLFVWLTFKEVITIGQLITLRTFSFFIFFPLNEIGSITTQYRETSVSLENFSAIINTDQEKTSEDAVDIGAATSVQFKDVGFTHRGSIDNKKAVDNINFDVKKGESIAFVGPSGAGKSTLIKLLVGFYLPNEGTITINNKKSGEFDLEKYRRQIGLVSQDTYLFSGSIRENLKFVKPDATDEEMVNAMKLSASHTLLDRAQNGLDTHLGEGGIKISGGEKQRLAIARALLRKPTILLFDEATSALDSLTEEEITHTIRELAGRKEHISVSIAHRLSTIMHVDRIYVLEKGKIIESGNHTELVAKSGLYAAMWRQQIGEK